MQSHWDDDYISKQLTINIIRSDHQDANCNGLPKQLPAKNNMKELKEIRSNTQTR